MKIIFVFPPIPYRFARTPYPPLGIGYLSAVLKTELGDRITSIGLIDGQLLSHEEYSNAVARIDADAVLISATIRQLSGAVKAAKSVRESTPNTFIVLGGSGPTSLFYQNMQFDLSPFNGVVVGEAEELITSLVLLGYGEGVGPDTSKCRISCFFDSVVYETTKKPNLQNLPLADRSIFDEAGYLKRWRDSAGMTSVHVMGSRGCPFECSFCDKSVTGRLVRYVGVSSVAHEMQQLYRRFRPNDIFYFDDLFTTSEKRVKALCSAIRGLDLDINWSAQGRVDTVSRPMLQDMHRSGCTELMFGVESGSERILSSFRKKITRDQIIAAFDLCHEIGIKPGAYLIIGVPGETSQDLDDTISLVRRIRPTLLNYSFLTPYPNTLLYQQTQQWIGEHDFTVWDDFSNTIYDYPFEIDPATALKEIQKVYAEMVVGGMDVVEYQFAND